MPETFPPEIGKYKILGVIAHGGMGVVYKAVHPSLKRYVVIKKMTARGNNSNAERFKREAQILLDLQSPYIVHLFDYFTEGGYRYMVEELVDGAALDKLLAKADGASVNR
jgi:serine/threonine protein kinase